MKYFKTFVVFAVFLTTLFASKTSDAGDDGSYYFKGEIGYGASFLEWFSEETKRNYGDVRKSHDMYYMKKYVILPSTKFTGK